MRLGRSAVGVGMLAGLLLMGARATAEDTRVFELRGIPAGNAFELTFIPGRPMSAVRIYSEPSHTFLLLIIDPDFKKSRAGKAWLRSHATPKPRATVTTDLPAGQPKVEVPAPPFGDDRVSVFIRATWNDGRTSDLKFASGKNDPAGFVMTADFLPSPPEKH